VAVSPALSAVFSFPVLDLEAVGHVERYFHADQMGLTGGMGVVADPAAVASFLVPHDVQVVKVPSLVSETCIGVGELDLDQSI